MVLREHKDPEIGQVVFKDESRIMTTQNQIYHDKKDREYVEWAAEEVKKFIICTLPPRDSSIFLRRFYHGISFKYIAESYSISEGYARVISERTMTRVRKYLSHVDNKNGSDLFLTCKSCLTT